MAEAASDVVEYDSATLRAGAWMRVWLRRIYESHQELKLHPVSQDMLRIVKALIGWGADIIRLRAGDIVRLGLLRPSACRVFFRSGWKKLIGNPHFHIISFRREHGDRFILRLPTKPRDCVVIAAPIGVALIGVALNAKRVAQVGRGGMTRQYLAVLN